MSTNSSAALLPAFDPLPSFSTSFQATAPSLAPDFSPLPSRSASPTPFPTPTASSLPSPQPSPTVPESSSTAFFARLRSNSVHNSAFPSSSSSASASHGSSSSRRRHQREISPPPLPSISSTPRNSRIVSNSSCKLSPPSLRNAGPASSDHIFPPSPSDAVPLIKSVTVPHHSKSGKNWLFACRVVPVAAAEGKGKARVYGLGKMEMATEQEPYTVYRSWSECVEFSSRLAQVFPDDRPTSYESRTDLFNHQVPRLSRKLVLFMTRSTLDQRQAELDLFCRRLFQMSQEVRNSLVVRSFFGLKTAAGGGAGGKAEEARGVSRLDSAAPPLSATYLIDSDSEDKNATIKPVAKPRRPALSVKTSTPNLRNTPKLFDADSDALSPGSGASRFALSNRAFTTDGADLRTPSSFSFASSTTLTPSLYAAQNASTLLATPAPSQEGRFKTLRKKASGPLRHFRSLQDLRGGSSPSLEVPDAPVPSLRSGFAAPPMMRFASQPPPRPTPTPLQFGGPARFTPGPTSAPIRPSHRRNGSSSSSIASTDGELWGTPYPTTFRQTPTGRLESVPLQQSQRSYSSSSHRRHGAAGGGAGSSISTQKASLGHSSSASISSLESLRSSTSIRSYDESGSGSGSRSARNSFDWGSVAGDGLFCPTPPTPQSPWAQKDGAFSNVNNNNMVPPPPFFPVPPSMASAHSHEGLSHPTRASHARKSSLECSTSSRYRSRTNSTASHRLDSLTASPSATSSTTTTSSPGIGGCDPRPKWTFKLLHEDENVVFRIAKEDLTLERLRSDTRAKFKAAGVDLSQEDAHWGLLYTLPTSNSTLTTPSKLIITREDLDECLAGATGKITFKVIT